MNDIELKIKEKSKQIILIMFLFFVILQTAILLTWYLGKKSTAEIIANGVHNLLFTGDIRSIIEILSPITPTTFSKLEIISSAGKSIELKAVNSSIFSLDIPIYSYKPINNGLSLIFYASLNHVIMASLLFILLMSTIGYFTFLPILANIRSSFEKELKLQLLQGKEAIFKQVAHDIRSPLSALNIITSTLTSENEEKRLLIRNSVQRINDIANDLLQKGKSEISILKQKNVSVPSSFNNNLIENEKFFHKKQNFSFLISTVMDNIVSEKRIQFREKINIHINVDLKNSFGLFVNANPNELSRVISNLINNSVEALPNQSGNIEVSVFINSDSKVCIQIRDNGSGIPKHILEKLGQAGLTHGKENTQSGSGLGVYHAIKTIQEFGGQIKFQSVTSEDLKHINNGFHVNQENVHVTLKESTGTTITIELPKEDTPDWFAESIQLKPDQEFITVDDDISIHQIWKGRLQSLKSNEQNIKITSFTSAKEFRKYFNKNLNSNLPRIFLIDYEFLNQNDNGLKIITDLGIQNKTILVTSRFDEPNIRSECEAQNIKILPKQLAGQIGISIMPNLDHNALVVTSRPLSTESTNLEKSKDSLNISNTMESTNTMKPLEPCSFENNTSSITESNLNNQSISIESIKYDLCLIDDDKLLVHSIWGMVAKEKGLNIKMFERPDDFLSEASNIDKATPIYVDVSLANNVNGIDVAKDIHKLGFENINLATGYESESIKTPNFIRQVVGKDFPL